MISDYLDRFSFKAGDFNTYISDERISANPLNIKIF